MLPVLPSWPLLYMGIVVVPCTFIPLASSGADITWCFHIYIYRFPVLWALMHPPYHYRCWVLHLSVITVKSFFGTCFFAKTSWNVDLSDHRTSFDYLLVHHTVPAKRTCPHFCTEWMYGFHTIMQFLNAAAECVKQQWFPKVAHVVMSIAVT